MRLKESSFINILKDLKDCEDTIVIMIRDFCKSVKFLQIELSVV